MKKIRKIVNALYTEMSHSNIDTYAANAAYFTFLSLIPLLLILFEIIPLTSISEKDVVTLITGFFPDYFASIIGDIINDVYKSAVATLSISIFILVWSGAKGILSIMKALNGIYELKENRNYFKVRFWACIYTVALMIMVVISLFIMVFGKALTEFILKDLPDIKYVVDVLLAFRFLFGWLLLVLFFVFLYVFIPNRHMKLMSQLPGAIFASVGWVIYSFCFSIYVKYSNALSMYGSISTVIMIMIWLYMCMYLLMLGALLNKIILTEKNKLLTISQ